MKRIQLFLGVLLFPFFLMAQGVEIVPFVGYLFSGSVNFVEGKLDVSDGVDYGIALLVPVHRSIDIEINYTRMDGNVRFDPYATYTEPPWNLKADESNMSTNCFQLGIICDISQNNPRIIPFGSFSAGATLFSMQKYKDTWRFSVAAGLGAKFMLSDFVGFMVRGRLMLPINFSGAGGYCGLGTGGTACGFTINSKS